MSDVAAYDHIRNLTVPPFLYELLAAEEATRPRNEQSIVFLQRRIDLIEAMVLYGAAQRANANT